MAREHATVFVVEVFEPVLSASQKSAIGGLQNGAIKWAIEQEIRRRGVELPHQTEEIIGEHSEWILPSIAQ